MAAGLGFKDFQTGEVLTAADVDGYLMQGIWVFASATARDAAVTSPQEGNFAFLKDTNVTTYYTGSAWTNLDTTGMVNPMTTTGDTIYSSSGSTPARLGIGTAGQILQVNSGATAPEWATPAGGGGMTLISTTTLTGASVSLTSIPTTYNDLIMVFRNVLPSVNGAQVIISFNQDTTANRHWYQSDPTSNTDVAFNNTIFAPTINGSSTTANGNTRILFPDYANTTTWKMAWSLASSSNASTPANFNMYESIAIYNQTAALTSFTISPNSGNFTSGTVLLYGVK
jgi:hypothetical protein